MRTLIYKRTHHGDPDASGLFGIYDCMGQVRRWDFDAVIGVGGVGPEARSHDLDGKINWIGIGPHKQAVPGKRGPIVSFDHFVFYGSKGPDFEKMAPLLAERIYSRNVRVVMDGLSASEQKEVDAILRLAGNAQPSPGLTMPAPGVMATVAPVWSICREQSPPRLVKAPIARLIKTPVKGCSR